MKHDDKYNEPFADPEKAKELVIGLFKAALILALVLNIARCVAV